MIFIVARRHYEVGFLQRKRGT